MFIPAFCMSYEHGIVLQECKSKPKQFHVHNPYKTLKASNKLSYCFGKVEENMDRSYIYLAVKTTCLCKNVFFTN